MPGRFEYFAIFAEMRTGSNLLEENLNDFPGLHCYGEVFNPHFMGHAKQTELLGVSLRDREKDPSALLARMKLEPDVLPGFRFFHDHDPRIKRLCLSDPACAKIILTRNPIESYVSREIARQTGQWRLGDGSKVKTTRIQFQPQEFGEHLASHQTFQLELLHTLQISGQTAFYIDYDDLGDVDVLNGLARFLRVDKPKKTTSKATKKQNPQPLHDKVSNYEEMSEALRSVDHFNLSRTPNFEPRRGPSVPSYVAAAQSPLLFVPIRGGPFDSVVAWMSELSGTTPDELLGGFTQKTLRHWKRQSRTHQSFTVLRHPVKRLHEVFARHILLPGPECYSEIRESLRNDYGVTIPDAEADHSYDVSTHRASFLKFAEFVKANLAAQTSIRIDAAWASQSEVLRGVGQFMIPDHVFREEDIEVDLGYLAGKIGEASPRILPEAENSPISLAAIYDEGVEATVKAAYQKDYMMFGFGPYRPDQAA